ncbi:MAG TPA: hypothetical protein DCK95_02280, partial [Anaerolineaceae bacterium]|nr:hypothetical protein [Anaerolineaceae bacterium]
MKRKISVLLVVLMAMLTACAKAPAVSTDINLPEGIVDANGGPVLITGAFDYTNDFVLETYYVEHAVMLTDMTGFILRDLEWELPIAGRAAGRGRVEIS